MSHSILTNILEPLDSLKFIRIEGY
ncbi:hypothetical protein CY0110_17487 [Crocosphaera chwakensis CCY0110]|uniref:Uncharacterized protein n=1 Tax=Crocosphaera chwakensis CCY0110 TaxID=391612 RepID=A3IIH9_9CHRO|nr:hypothetical protein CY0110_17487 [Crocosphaera chwakensis CCY0110]